MSPETGWFPIASSDDLVERHVYLGQLLGRELAVWRADDGSVNVWDNRCLHRGVRLTLGSNEGGELVCRYHGWRYASRTAGCTYIPAHPGEAPGRTVCNVSHPAVEYGGLVWTTVDHGGPFSAPAGITERSVALRALPIDAPATTVRAALAEEIDRWSVDGSPVVAVVQPMDEHRCVVRPVLAEPPASCATIALDVLRHQHRLLAALRERVEVGIIATRSPAADLQRIQQRTPPRRPAPGTARTTIPVTVAARRDTAVGVRAVELRPVGGQLPTAQPGDHIDVALPNGITRQYSLVNAPGELDAYVIGVKRESTSRGGSAWIHDDLTVGDQLTISEPRHQFVLRRDSFRTLLIAGGIGITPLLAMAQALHANGLDFALHVFAQSAEHVPFGERLAGLGDTVVRHLGLDPAATAAAVTALLAGPGEGEHVYVCGPAPMIGAVQDAAAAAGWPAGSVHVEYFANPADTDTAGAFTVELARSATVIEVPAGTTLLDALRGHGVDVPSSCEQGTCGTCVVGVLDGRPLHQDVYLDAAEHAAGRLMTTCVSRAAPGTRLVLDLEP